MYEEYKKKAQYHLPLAFSQYIPKIKKQIDEDITSLDILVPGAGNFPSLEPFVKELQNNFPHLNKINFTLIDHKQNTRPLPTLLNVTVNYYIGDFKSILETNLQNSKFDIVYFEHPETFFVDIFSPFFNTFRESFGELGRALKDKSLIITTHLNTAEAGEAQKLLGTGTSFKKNPDFYPYAPTFFNSLTPTPERYSVIGVYYPSEKPTPSSSFLDIRIQDKLLALMLIATMAQGLYHQFHDNKGLLTAGAITSGLFNYTQRDYGKKGYVIKALCFILQVMMIAGSLYSSFENDTGKTYAPHSL